MEFLAFRQYKIVYLIFLIFSRPPFVELCIKFLFFKDSNNEKFSRR